MYVKEMNYNQYHFTWKDWCVFGSKVCIKTIIVCYLFFDSYKAALIGVLLGVWEYKSYKNNKKQKRKQELTMQFKSMMEAISTALCAGYSLEHAFSEAQKDLRYIYSENAFIFCELAQIQSGLKLNIPIEQLVKKFGDRSGIEDIEDFANVLMIAKKSGGNLIHIIQKTVNRISEKIEVEEEISTLIASKKYEQQIMMMMPYGIIFYLRITNAGYFDVLYENVAGWVIMMLFLVVIWIADMWAGKIMEISV